MNRYRLLHPLAANSFGRVVWLISLLICSALSAASPNPRGGKAEPDPEARALAQDLVSRQPEKELVLEGVFKIRHAKGRRSEVPMRYSVVLGQNQWQSIYRTAPTATHGPEQLLIRHQPGHPNRYQFTQINLDASRTNSIQLLGAQAAVSFAGSDFWLADLGLEFLHWPEQRLLRDAKIKMRLGRPCHVLESLNPAPSNGTYGRVVSWIDIESGGLIRAEAYDLTGKRFKTFTVDGFKKVGGQWQVSKIEIVNEKTDSQTQLEFVFRD